MIDDDDTLARRPTVPQLLGVLDDYARRGDVEMFHCAEWVLTRLLGAEAGEIADAQAVMAPADVARWNAARSAMFQKAVGQMWVSMS